MEKIKKIVPKRIIIKKGFTQQHLTTYIFYFEAQQQTDPT
jgi:hypothetical protein